MMSAIRTAVERLTRGWTLTRRLPNGARVVVTPDAQLKYLARSFDDNLIALARDHVRQGDIVWDVGANCGIFAFSCAHAARVIAIEADPFLCSILQRSIVYGDAPVSLVCGAVFSSPGLAEFSIAMRGRAGNHISGIQASTQTGGSRAQLVVPTVTLDSLIERCGAPNLVKIDIEGAELDALQGASRLLNEVRPIIYMESGDETREAVQSILRRYNYKYESVDHSNWLCTPLT